MCSSDLPVLGIGHFAEPEPFAAIVAVVLEPTSLAVHLLSVVVPGQS